jgi:peptide/nickel transport system substrate-binding protein
MRSLPVLAAFAATLSACAAPQPAPPSSVVHFDISADPASLDPLFARTDAGSVDQQLAHLAFEPFFDLDAAGRPVPELLAVIPTQKNGGISRDGRTIVYRLRPGVHWSDGVEVSARDVLFTLHAIVDPANPVPSREGYELIDRADSPDSHTVRFHLKRAWAPAVATLFSYGTAPQYVLPAHVLEKEPALARATFSSAPTVGDGPFLFERWKRGDRLVYRANPRYWRGRPKVDELDVAIVPDPNSNLTLLRSGAIDFNLVAPVQIPVLGDKPEIAFVRVPTAIVAGLALNTRHPPLDDVRVRRALAASIDRAAISRKITYGNYPVADSDRPRFSWAFDTRIKEPAYDPQLADRLFDEAGWRRAAGGRRSKGGRALELSYVQFVETTTGMRVAAFAQRQLHERGVEATIKQMAQAQFYLPKTGALAAGNFDLAYVPWTLGADPDDRFLLGCSGPANYMRYCNPEVERLEDAALVDPHEAARREAYRSIDGLVARDVPILYLFNARYVYAYNRRLHGFAPNAFSPTWNAYDWSLK